MFPPSSVTPPVFTQYPSVYFNGVTFGPGPFLLRADGNFDGIFMPNVRSNDTAAARAHGNYAGLDLLDERTITVNIDVGPPFGSYGSLSGAMAALGTALAPQGNVELPLFLQLSSNAPMLATMVRARKFDPQVDIAYVMGHSGGLTTGLAQKIPLQFVATDPIWYAAGTLSPSVGVPTPPGGFGFPFGFPLTFGGGVEYGSITATNFGNNPVWPIITFTGPCKNPVLLNTATGYSLGFGLTMQTSDTLVVNCDPKYPSAVYYNAGSNAGYSVGYALSAGSVYFSINPGVNLLQFTTADASSTSGFVTVEYTSGFAAAA